MSTAIANPQFDEASARGLTDEVKADAAALWAKLLDLYEGGAHLALGYASWGAYYEAEFGGSKSAAYRILDAARVVPQLGNAPTPAREAVARELAPLRAAPEQMREVWAEAVEQHGPEPTAAQVREIVRPALSAEQLARAEARLERIRLEVEGEDPLREFWPLLNRALSFTPIRSGSVAEFVDAMSPTDRADLSRRVSQAIETLGTFVERANRRGLRVVEARSGE